MRALHRSVLSYQPHDVNNTQYACVKREAKIDIIEIDRHPLTSFTLLARGTLLFYSFSYELTHAVQIATPTDHC